MKLSGILQVWPGGTHYPDFLNPATQAYWEGELREFHKALPYDGIWIDMNEASNFCTGEVCRFPDNSTGSNLYHLAGITGTASSNTVTSICLLTWHLQLAVMVGNKRKYLGHLKAKSNVKAMQ